MERIQFLACCVVVAFFGIATLCCAVAGFWQKMRNLSLWLLPKGPLSVLALVAVAATLAAQKIVPAVPRDMYETTARLFYWSTLDSAEAIVAPPVGPGGTCSGATFVKGKVGLALSVPAGTNVVTVTLPDGLPQERGCIEFWAKLDGDKEAFGMDGDPMLIHLATASTLEHFGWIEFNANHETGCVGLGAKLQDVTFYTGNLDSSGSYGSVLSGKATDWHHYALVWNIADGLWHFDGCPCFALLLDGVPVAQARWNGNWDSFVANMSVPLQLNLGCPAPGMGKSAYLIDELRIWDWDKTMFSSYLENPDVRYVDMNAQEGGLGLSWNSAVRSIDEACRNMASGTVYVKPGVYGAFSLNEHQGGTALTIVATGTPQETVIDGSGIGALECCSGSVSSGEPALRLQGFTVRNMNARLNGAMLERCVVSNFTHGVAIASTFTNCLLVANAASSEKKLFDSCSFVNCTVAGNSSAEGSSMIGCGARNAIFWDNGSLDYTGLDATNCCVESGVFGAFNIDGDPKFVDPAKGDWHLASDSPCVDAGDNAFVEGDLDLAGNARIRNGCVDIGAYETIPPSPPARLVYHNTLDSADAVEHPEIGAAGTCSNATFVAGKVGSALCVPAHSTAAIVPLPDGLPTAKGCVEFWAKLEEGKTTYRDGGDPIFMIFQRVDDGVKCFSFEYNANNGGGRGGLCAGFGYLNIASESYSYMKNYSTYITRGGVSDWHHYAYVWNVDGIATLNGLPRAAILVDGDAVAQTHGENSWNRNEFLENVAKPVNVIFGVAQGSNNGKSSFAIDEFKIWDSDKTAFRGLVTHQSVSYVYDGTSHTLQQAVGAEGDEVFRYALSEEGPFVEEMPTITDAGSIRIWYEVEAEGETTRASATVTVTKRPLVFTSASAQKPYDGIPLSATNVLVSGGVPQGEGFAFSVSGSRTIVGESVNAFTWSAEEGTKPDNYDVTVVYGTLKVTMEALDAGTEYEIIHGETDAVRITRLPYPNGGDVALPSTLGGLPVAEIAAGALAGTGVTGVHVPSGVLVAGALFENLPNVTNVTLDAGCAVTGALSCRGSAALQEVIVPASVTELAPHAFLGCWALERVVFAGEPPFGNNTDATAELALLTASVRPASLLQMADMICYPASCAVKWEKSLRNLGYGGKYGAYAGEWTGLDSLIADSGNLNKDTGGAVPPTEQPSAHYAAQTGVASGTVMPGTAGWDAFGVPDGMTWDKETGTLGGTPKRSGTYDVILVSGSGADTKMMRTTVDVAGYAVTTGYVGVAFKVSGAPWNALASYKAAPKGLAWKSKVLSGIPTKAGTTTYKTKDGEPVKVTILALPVGAKGTFNGILQDTAGKQYPLKVTASAAGKLTATVTKGTKSYSLSAAKWSKVTVETVDGAPHRMFAATLTASGLSLSVKVDADAAWNADALTAVGTQGAVKNLTGTAQRNSYASDAAAQEAAAARAGTYALAATADAGGWTLAPEAGSTGALTVVIKATGAATLTGTLPNKAKVSASSTLHVDAEGAATVRFYVSGKWITWHPL